MNAEKVYIEFLVLQVQAGETDIWSKLLPLLKQKMLAYAKRLLNGDVDAEDCVQEAMMMVVKRIGQLRDVKAFHSWLYKVTHSRCMDELRKLNTNLDAVGSVMSLTEFDPIENDVGPVSDQNLDVNKAINRLPKIQQAVVFLFYFEGFTVVEISVILEKPAGTIKSHLFEARAAIKSFLSQE